MSSSKTSIDTARVLRLEADTLVLALGREPVNHLFHDLVTSGVRVVGVGDCIGPRSIEEAVLEGTLALTQPPDARLPSPLLSPRAGLEAAS